MPAIQQIASNVRLLVDEPLPNKVSGRRLLMAVMEALQSFYSHLQNSGQAWSLKADYTLNVSSNTSDYLLAIDNSFGKPIQVLTYYPQNPSYVQRYIDFVEMQDLNFNWPYPVNVSSFMFTDGSNCTAMRMAFYYKDDGSRWVRVLPQPNLSASYLLTFSSGDWASTANIADSPVLSQFHSLVEIWAAQSILPSCQWDSNNQNYNMAHRKELAAALENDRVRIADGFDRYVRNTVDDRMSIRESSFDDMSEWSNW